MFSIYSPTSSSDLREADSFYHCLSDAIVATPRRHMLLVCGDFNATLAPGDARSKHCPRQRLNRNRDLLRDLADGADLVAVNTQFQKPRYRLVTFYGPRGRQACLDHILVWRKWCSSFLDCEAKQVHNVKSDHAALIVKCRWRLATQKTKVPHCTRRDWDKLHTKHECRADFISHIKGSCREDGEVKYSLFANAIRTATTSIPALSARQRVTPWAEDEDILTLRQELVDARRALQVDRNSAIAMRKVELAARALSDLHSMKREEAYQSMMKEAESCDEANRHKAAWQLINMLTGRKVSEQGIIAADTPTERLQGWRNHFETLLSPADSTASKVPFHCEPMFQSPPQFEQGPITSEELDSAVKALRTGRAPGLDQVTAESLKLPELHEELLAVLNSVYLSGTVPPEWHLSALIPISKKRDLSLRNNYRGIALMSIPAKLYNRVLLSRIRRALDSHLRNNQNGFRPHRSTTQHVLT